MIEENHFPSFSSVSLLSLVCYTLISILFPSFLSFKLKQTPRLLFFSPLSISYFHIFSQFSCIPFPSYLNTPPIVINLLYLATTGDILRFPPYPSNGRKQFAFTPYPTSSRRQFKFPPFHRTAEDNLISPRFHPSNEPTVFIIPLSSKFHCCKDPNAFFTEEVTGK